MSVASIKEAATRYATILSEVITVHAEMDSSFHQTIIRVMVRKLLKKKETKLE